MKFFQFFLYCIQNEKLSKQTIYYNTTIIQKELHNQKLIIKESLEIIEKKPSFNDQEDKWLQQCKTNLLIYQILYYV